MASSHACCLTTALATFAADRGLIMTISAYPKSPLPGVTLDDANARKILGRIGFETDNVRSLRDGELKAASIVPSFTSPAMALVSQLVVNASSRW